MEEILIPVSLGELVDKISILEIKSERLTDSTKLCNVRNELDALLPLWRQAETTTPALAELKRRIKAINERMWDVQDALRAKEAAQTFDEEFIRLARAVFTNNGERVSVKAEINRLGGSQFVEEKQYKVDDAPSAGK